MIALLLWVKAEAFLGLQFYSKLFVKAFELKKLCQYKKLKSKLF